MTTIEEMPPFSEIDPLHNRLHVADGLPVNAPVCVLDEARMTIVAVQMIGSPTAVNATWAALVNGNSRHYIDGVYIELKGMKQHIRLNKMLPCGWKETWLIHKQATLEYMDPAQEYFYLLPLKAGVPDLFFPMLNHSLPTPMLESWIEYLWQVGKARSQILALQRYNCVGMGTWLVRTKMQIWETIVSNALAHGDLTY